MTKSRSLFQVLLVMVLVAALTGCAARDQIINKGNFNEASMRVPKEYLPNYEGKDIEKTVIGNLLLPPYETTGIKELPAFLRGEATGYEVPFPKELKEEQPTEKRIKWYAWVISEGIEDVGQLAKRTINKMGELVIGKSVKALKNAKALILSTRTTKAFGFSVDDKGVDISREKFMSDETYRKELVEKYGSRLSDFELSDKLIKDMYSLSWARYETDLGYILTPLSEEEFREFVPINPGYTMSQRAVDQYWVISTNVPGMIIQDLIINPIIAATGSTSGWDFDSLKKLEKPQEEENAQTD